MDRIGPWSIIKHKIISEYISAYCQILSKQKLLNFEYIDAFSGDGLHVDKRSGQVLEGSPLRALDIKPPFKKYHFIDINSNKIDDLRERTKENPSVRTYNGDCNDILINQIFPGLPYSSYKRAVCILDPYGLHLNWNPLN
ncbi:MAG: three-Cys-motif partner protein TcmP [Nitrospirae bacterium]|nr:three-Cys-motif partner protein TcmP [Nitrospirota bacterium]